MIVLIVSITDSSVMTQRYIFYFKISIVLQLRFIFNSTFTLYKINKNTYICVHNNINIFHYEKHHQIIHFSPPYYNRI